MDAWKSKAALVEKICDFARSEFSGEDTEDLCRFIVAFYRSAFLEELTNAPVEELGAAVASMWRLALVRAPGRPKIAVFNPKRRRDGWDGKNTVIQIINDDMPFLVDSVTGGLTVARRLELHALHHPILSVKRDNKGRRIKTLGAAKNGKPDGTEARRELTADLGLLGDATTLLGLVIGGRNRASKQLAARLHQATGLGEVMPGHVPVP